MGGFGSGRWQDGYSRRRRAIVEESDWIDAGQVARPEGVELRDGLRLRVMVEYGRATGPVQCTGPYTVEAVACRFGGFRWFWLCPGCGKRRMRLYQARGGDYWCRACLGLTYWTRRKRRAYDAIIRSMMADGGAARGWTPFLFRRLMFDHVGRKRGRRWWMTTAAAAIRSGLVAASLPPEIGSLRPGDADAADQKQE